MPVTGSGLRLHTLHVACGMLEDATAACAAAGVERGSDDDSVFCGEKPQPRSVAAAKQVLQG